MFDVTQLAGLACVFMRMSGCILLNPILGRRNFPTIFRVGMTMVLSIMVITYSEVAVDFGSGTFIVTCAVLLKELFIGFVMGTIVSFFSYTIVIGGAFIDMQMALSMTKMYDPQNGTQMSISSTFFNLMLMFAFFGMNAHLQLIYMFLRSAEIVPYGAVLFVNPELPMTITDIFVQCTILGLKMAMPIAGMLFLVQMGVGILMKTVPQINAFVVMLQVKILAGLFMLAVVFSPLSNFIERIIPTMFQTLATVLLLL